MRERSDEERSLIGEVAIRRRAGDRGGVRCRLRRRGDPLREELPRCGDESIAGARLLVHATGALIWYVHTIMVHSVHDVVPVCADRPVCLRQEGADDVSAVPIVRTQGEGERLRFFGGGILTMKATAEETGGAFLLFEDLMSQGKTTPLHVHVDEDETLYVLAGEIVVHIAGENHVLAADGIAVAPRGVPHAFLVTSETARVLTLQTPGSAEAFYRGASEPAGTDMDPSGPIDFARVRESAETFGGMRVLGPPPFERRSRARAKLRQSRPVAASSTRPAPRSAASASPERRAARHT